MKINRKVILFIGTILIILKMLTNNNIFLISFLFIASLGIVFDNVEDKVIYLLFFIPFVYVIKFNFNQTSLFLILSIEYILVSLIYIIKNKLKIDKGLIFFVILFCLYILSVSIITNFNYIFSTIGFLINYLVVGLAIILINKRGVFVKYSLSYVLGVTIAAIIGAIRLIIPSINTYLLNMTVLNTVLTNNKLQFRLSGLDLDPNYYASQILISITLLSIISYYKKESKYIIWILLLSILGLSSLSKMYVIVIILYIILMLPYFFKDKLSLFKKIIPLLLIITLIYTLFGEYFISAYFTRLVKKGSAVDISTGRFDLWINYIYYFSNNFIKLIFGNGISGVFLDDKAAHNIYISIVYSFGIVGIMFWIKSLQKIYCKLSNKQISRNKFLNYIPLIIMLVLNLSLDSIYMDSFYYEIMLIMMAINYKEK